MKGLITFFFLLAGCLYLAGANSKTNSKTIMLFPKTITDFVTLKPTEKVLSQITVCLRSYTDLTRGHALFSLATPDKNNAFLIFTYPPKTISISINDEDYYFPVDPEVSGWRNMCVTWDSENGLLQLWINGKRYSRKVTKTRSPIGPEMSVVLGQDQDTYGGGFDISQTFVGEMCDVNMWDHVLPTILIKAYLSDQKPVSGNLYSWKTGNYAVNGSVLILNEEQYP